MKYGCPQCQGHVEIDGEYQGQAMTCPHCQGEVQFEAIGLELATGAAPPVPGDLPLSELAGPDQDAATVAGVMGQIKGYCTEGESVLRVVVQSKLFAVSIKPDLVVATNRRIIILSRGMFSCQMWDAIWVDVRNVEISESISGATILVTKTNGVSAKIEKLPKSAARDFYRFCQGKEDIMRSVRYMQQIHTASAGAAKVNVTVGG